MFMYLIYMLVLMCILLGHVRYVHLICLQIDVYVTVVIFHEMYIDLRTRVVMMLYDIVCVLLDVIAMMMPCYVIRFMC